MKKRQMHKILKKIYGKPVPLCPHTDIEGFYCIDCGADLTADIISNQIDAAELQMENL